MKLTKKQLQKLDKRTTLLERNEIIHKLVQQMKKTELFLEPLIQNDMNGWEMTKHQPHPLIFELGHITLFYMHHFLRHFTDFSIDDKIYQMFDSIQNTPNERIQTQIIPFEDQYKLYNKVFNNIFDFNEKTCHFTNHMKYSLNLCILHNEMHNEVLLFLLDMLEYPNPVKLRENSILYNNNNDINNKFVYVEGGLYKQGLDVNDRVNVLDNEMPKHIVEIKSFYCNTYPTTNSEYIQFIEDGGYTNTSFWSSDGKKWLKKEKANMPKFWLKKNKIYYRKHFDKQIPILNDELKKPVVKINFYEAEAYAKYKKCRLPTESEYEYMCTNRGTTLYPWGNDSNVEKYSNVNYKQSDVVPVDTYECNKNIDGIIGLMGDCWYWTSTRFYPYDGYTIDPLYDTFSFPFFYFRTIVKGAAWTCGEQLVYPQYRNAQEPDKRFHYTGIRLIKDV